MSGAAPANDGTPERRAGNPAGAEFGRAAAAAPRALSLQHALALAAERNPDLSLSAIALRAAQAGLLQADVSPNPALTLSAQNINPRQGVGPGSLRDKQVDTTIRMEQLIERGGKRELRAENANRLVEASRSDLQEAQRQLRLQVSIAYVELQLAQQRLAIGRETMGLYENTLAAAGQRRAAGDIAGSEYERLRVDYLRARNDTLQAESELRRAQAALLLMMGFETVADPVLATDPWPAPVAPDWQVATQLAIERRPDIQAASARLSAAEAALRLAQASRTRDVVAGVQFDRSPASPMNGFYGSNTVGVSVQVPLFVNNQFEGEIRNAAAGLDNARENLRKRQQQAHAELQRARNDLGSALERLERFRQELTPSATRAAQAAEFAFRNGASSVTDVLDARRTLRAITLDELNARADHARAMAAWKAATLEDQP